MRGLSDYRVFMLAGGADNPLYAPAATVGWASVKFFRSGTVVAVETNEDGQALAGRSWICAPEDEGSPRTARLCCEPQIVRALYAKGHHRECEMPPELALAVTGGTPADLGRAILQRHAMGAEVILWLMQSYCAAGQKPR